jgi:phosphate transport system permease protein
MGKNVWDMLLELFAWCCAILLAGSMILIIGFLIVKGYTAISLELIFANTSPLDALLLKQQVFGGLFPAMVGTFLLILLSIGFALPLGLASGIFLAEYAPDSIKKIFSLCFDILAGVPSIVIGLFGFSITILLHHSFNSQIFPCLLISALSLAFLVLPYIIKATQVALESIPLLIRLTAPSLGATKLENIFLVLLPASISDISSGIVLAIGRCAEDTAVIMLTGVVAVAGIPKSIFSGFEALPFYIYYIASEYSDQSELMKGYGAAMILLLICAGLFGISHWVKKWLTEKTRFSY